MDLILIDNVPDAIAVKTPYCARCVQEKLSVTILRRWNLEHTFCFAKRCIYEFERTWVHLFALQKVGYNISCGCKKSK